jgi:hypothetical protein
MHWRSASGEILAAREARRLLRVGIASGRVRGVLAYVDGIPVGWCSHGLGTEPREDGLRSVPCFYRKAGYRKKAVSRALVTASLKWIGAGGAKRGHPVRLPKEGEVLPAFSCTGTEAAAFPARREGSRPRMRLVVG